MIKIFSFFISEDCAYFNLESPDFSLAEETKRDMEDFSQMWGLYEEWQEGFMEKAREDWIRKSLGHFNRFKAICEVFDFVHSEKLHYST